MTKPILVAYTTNAGSTAEVAEAIGKELRKAGVAVDVRQFGDVASIDGYSAVILGAPIMLGWHRAARRFIRRHQSSLIGIPVAYFATALQLTRTSETSVGDIPLHLDSKFGHPPKKRGRLSLHERFTSVEAYVRPMLKTAPKLHPVSIGLFQGKLDPKRLSFLQRLFIGIVIRAKPGDFRNWQSIRTWAGKMSALLAHPMQINNLLR